MRVAKWGNSLAVRLPAAVVQALDPKEGEAIELHVVGALGSYASQFQDVDANALGWLFISEAGRTVSAGGDRGAVAGSACCGGRRSAADRADVI